MNLANEGELHEFQQSKGIMQDLVSMIS